MPYFVRINTLKGTVKPAVVDLWRLSTLRNRFLTLKRYDEQPCLLIWDFLPPLPPGLVKSIIFLFGVVLNNQVKERIRQEQEEEKQRLEAEMQRLMALEEDHRRKVQLKEQEMGKIKEDLEKKWDRERRQVL